MNIKKIKDEYLLNGTFVFGNVNDRVNLINRVCPSLSNEQMDEIFNKLSELGVENYSKIFFVLGNEALEDAILTYPVRDLVLSFRYAD